MLKKYSVLFGVFLFFVVLYLFADRATEGFRPREIKTSQTLDLGITPQALTEEKKEFLKKLFQQEFHYVGKGCQFYVFESEDHSHVIKLPKQKHLRSYEWVSGLFLPTKIKNYFENKSVRKHERICKLFSSCNLAYEELPKETGIIHLHLTCSNIWKKEKLILTDKLGLKHQILLSEYNFLIQKKAERVYTALSKEMPIEQVKEHIHQLAEVVIQRCKKGIKDCDRSFVQNVAFAIDQSHAVFIDVGQFVNEESMKNPEQTWIELQRRMNSLGYWIERYFPKYIHLVKEELALLEMEYKPTISS